MNVELEALKKRLFVDSQVKNIKFYPGVEGDSTPEDFAREINKFFADAENQTKSLDLDVDTEVDG